MVKNKTLIIGTYTVKTESKGIYVVKKEEQVDTKHKPQYITAKNPSYLAIIPHKNKLYFVEEIGDQGGRLKSTTLPPTSQDLAIDFDISTHGSAPCHIAISPTEDLLIVSNYMSGNFSCYELDTDGNITSFLSSYKFNGKSIHPKRQLQSHIHSAAFSIDGHKVYIQDLGADCIYQFNTIDLRQDNQPYTTFKLKPGSGPRHMALSSKQKIYLVNELSGSLEVLSIDEQNRISSSIQNIPLKKSDTQTGSDLGAHISISKDERHLYATNRGERDEISVYSINKKGLLTQIQVISSMGLGPRHFEFSADETELYIANQRSNLVQKFERDPHTGLLSYVDKQISIPSPVFIAIL